MPPWEKYYDEAAKGLSVPEKTLVEIFSDTVAGYGNKPAMIFLDEKITYQQYDEFSDAFASFLVKNGGRPGDKIAINLPNLPQYLVALVGSLKAGLVISGLSALATGDEMKRQLDDLSAKFLVTFDQVYAEKVAAASNGFESVETIVVTRPLDMVAGIKQFFARLLRKLPFPEILAPTGGQKVVEFKEILSTGDVTKPEITGKPGDICAIQYTGGTTGKPKGAMLSHYNLVANMYQGMAITRPEYGCETGLSILPFFHIAGLTAAFNTIVIGGAWVLVPNPRDLGFIIRNIRKHKPSLIFAVPLLYQKIIQQKAFRQINFSFLKHALSGASTYPSNLVEPLQKIIGPKLIEGYGMTEASPGITCTPPGYLKPGSVGIPLPLTSVKILDLETESHELETGIAGHLIVRGPQVMQGYFRQDRAETLREFNGKTWLFTGDVAYLDEDGFVFICDRIKDMVNVAGYKVFSLEVEDILLQHDAIDYCAILADHIDGKEVVRLVMQPAVNYQQYSSDELKEIILDYCRLKLAPYKVPKIIDVVTEIATTPIGKVDKKRLKAI